MVRATEGAVTFPSPGGFRSRYHPLAAGRRYRVFNPFAARVRAVARVQGRSRFPPSRHKKTQDTR